MKPIGWTDEVLRVRCESCEAESTLDWEVYLDALRGGTPASCPACQAEQTVQDRRQREVPVSVDRRKA
jgi:hypothetical protein